MRRIIKIVDVSPAVTRGARHTERDTAEETEMANKYREDEMAGVIQFFLIKIFSRKGTHQVFVKF